MVVDFFEREGCHLCHEALPVVEAEAARVGAQVRRHDIAADADLLRAYGELIPVVEIDGKEHSRWFVDAKALHAALESRLMAN